MRTSTPTDNSLKIPLIQKYLQPLDGSSELRAFPSHWPLLTSFLQAAWLPPATSQNASGASAQGDLDNLRPTSEPEWKYRAAQAPCDK
jgi:hypothetical protein